MEQFLGCDAHKKDSVFVAVNAKGHVGEAFRVAHDRELYRDFLARLPSRSVIAVEACGHYSWLVDEMERLGHCPKLYNPLEAKRRMGLTKKTNMKPQHELLRSRSLFFPVSSKNRTLKSRRAPKIAVGESC
jgi:transposase